MKKQDAKMKYNNLLKRHQYFGVEYVINTKRQQGEYYEILWEILDTSLECVQCLSKEETEIVRKYIGMYGREYTITEISEELNKRSSYAGTMLNKIAEILRTRISRGCAHLKDAYINHEITLNELLNTRLFDMDYDHGIKILNIMSVNGFKTIGDLVKKSIPELKKCRNASGKILDDLIDYIHSLGLIFKGEAPIYESVEEKPKTTPSLVKALDELDKEAEEINKIIEETQERQQRI